MILVVDSGVTAKWYVQEEHTSEAELLVDRSFELHAPDLFLPEFANILWKKFRNNELSETTAFLAIESIRNRGIIFHPGDALLRPSLAGSIETGHSTYDWTYLALAISLDSRLVTADRKFFMAMRKTRFKRYLVWIEHLESLNR